MNTFEGQLSGVEARFAILVTRWNSFVAEHLKDGAIDTLKRHGISEKDIDVIYVPGAFELPLVAQKAAKSKKYDAIVALGAVIRGGTPHFDFVANECVKGLAQVGLETSLPISFGVLTVDSIEQAIERSGTKAGNKGEEAALTALETVSLLRAL